MRLRETATLTLAVLAMTGAVAAPSAGAKAPIVKQSQELAALRSSHKVVSSLGAHPAQTSAISASRPITGGQTVLPIVRHATKNGVRWLQVRLPGRPNGRKGWIKEHDTTLSTTRWHLLVRVSTRRVLVYRNGKRVRTFSAIVGTPATPTPRGRFFVEESVDLYPGSVGGPFALATSARSNVLQEFAGGPGQIALHGVEQLSGTMGTAASHGCVRLNNTSIRWLAARIAPGVPVTISG